MSKLPNSNKIKEFFKNLFAALFVILIIMIIGYFGGKEFEDRKDMDIQKKEWQEDMQKLDERLKRLEEQKQETKNEETGYNLEKVGFRTITCYSSTPEQTDSSPFITASGQHVRDGIIATNEFPFGTKLMINGNVYEVQDRTNSRYSYRIDVWKSGLEEALQCGVSTAEVFKIN